jgi:uncharacterized DUF497 family protein
MTYTEGVRFEWDPRKDQANQKKYGLSFDQAVELFTGDNDYLEIYDEGHSDEEDRFIAIGLIRAGVVVVVYTERREDVIRLVSARRATKKEVLLVQQYFGGIDG